MAAMSPKDPRLSVHNLGLSRGGRRLFGDISFELGAGEALLLRGPNGVGKSSLLLALAGILRPESGSIGWAGEPPLHLLTHQSGIKSRLSLVENLRFWQAVNGPTGMAPEAALDRLGLGGLYAIEAGHLSAGQTRRLALARLLVTDRAAWLLDEPTAALDLAGGGLLDSLIADRLGSGGLVIAATHDDLAGGTQSLVLGAPS
jgi:heme exporter protein A